MKLAQLKIEIEDQQIESKESIENPSIVMRLQASEFREFLQSNLIKVIVGVRRSGKSTLALLSMKKHKYIYFNFDSEILGSIESNNLNQIFEIGLEIQPDAHFFIFDEIQNVEGWELFINKLHRKKKNIILTGSNSRLLSSELTTHLTGRVLTLELLPFSFREFLGSNFKSEPLKIEERVELKRRLQDYIDTGGFPDLIQFEKGSKIAKQYLFELYDRIISRDLIQRRKIRNIKAIKDLSLLLLSLNSSRFTFQSLKRNLNFTSINTVKNYVDFFCETYLGFIVEPFSYKVKARISLPKKFYSIDPTLVESVLKVANRDLGKKLENIIYLELRRRKYEIYYLYQNNYEVDFALVRGRTLMELIQVTWDISDNSTYLREVSSLIKAAKEFKVSNLTIISFESNEDKILKDGFEINILPAWKWLLMNYD